MRLTSLGKKSKTGMKSGGGIVSAAGGRREGGIKKYRGAARRGGVMRQSQGLSRMGLVDEREHLSKVRLADEICFLITRNSLNQTEAAARLGVDQPKISALMRGQIGQFSTERLFRFLNALGHDVKVIVRPAKKPRTASVYVGSA